MKPLYVLPILWMMILLCGAVPYAPIHLGVPTPPSSPPPTATSTNNNYYVVTNYVYQVEYQTNSASQVITEVRHVDATNMVTVASPIPMITIEVERSTNLVEWVVVDTLYVPMKQKDPNGYYRATTSILK